jgi:hypothetical protein
MSYIFRFPPKVKVFCGSPVFASMTVESWSAATLLLGLVLASGSLAAQQAPGLIAKNPIRLTNVEGRMDHLGVDLKGQRLLVTAFDNHTLEVLDLKTGGQMHIFRV